jgi:hypothetical protein
MTTNLRRLQVRLNDDLLAQVRQLQHRLSLTDSAVGSLLIAAGLKQFEQLGLVAPFEPSATPVEPVVAKVKPKQSKQSQVPMKDEPAPLGFRTKGEYEEHEHEHEQLPVVVRRDGWTGYISGL